MREEILKVAALQLYTGGYCGLNFADIAEELSTTRANIHYHFKSKELLAEEVTRIYISQVRDSVSQMRSQASGDLMKFVTLLEKNLHERLKGLEVKGFCICSQLVQNINFIPIPLGKLARSHFEWLLLELTDIVGESKKKGKISSKISSKEIAGQVLSLFLGEAQLILGLGLEAKAKVPNSIMRDYVAHLT